MVYEESVIVRKVSIYNQALNWLYLVNTIEKGQKIKAMHCSSNMFKENLVA